MLFSSDTSITTDHVNWFTPIKHAALFLDIPSLGDESTGSESQSGTREVLWVGVDLDAYRSKTRIVTVRDNYRGHWNLSTNGFVDLSLGLGHLMKSVTRIEKSEGLDMGSLEGTGCGG